MKLRKSRKTDVLTSANPEKKTFSSLNIYIDLVNCSPPSAQAVFSDGFTSAKELETHIKNLDAELKTAKEGTAKHSFLVRLRALCQKALKDFKDDET